MIEVIVHLQRGEEDGGDVRTTFSDDNLDKAEKMIQGLQGYNSGFYSGVIEHISSEGRVVLKYVEK